MSTLNSQGPVPAVATDDEIFSQLGAVIDGLKSGTMTVAKARVINREAGKHLAARRRALRALRKSLLA